MPPTSDDPLQSPQDSDQDVGGGNIRITKTRDSPQRPTNPALASVASLAYRRSNASLSQLFQSTSSLPLPSGSNSGTVTPNAAAVNGSVFSPGNSTRVGSPAPSVQQSSGAVRELVLNAFAPHVSVLASQDAEELVRHKGIDGGLLELLRPFGEHVQGKVTIRDSNGSSLSWDDYAIRFIGVKDGLESPRMADRRSTDSANAQRKTGHERVSSLEFKPARLRSGGDVLQVEELVERHLTFAEEQSGPIVADYLTHKEVSRQQSSQGDSPFYLLYLRRLLSGMPMVPSETISHPVATVIAISSRSKAPIEELRNLFASSNSGDDRLPQWLPHCEWSSAAEELAEIIRQENSDDDDDPSPYIFESDASAIRAFVRELVTQSIVPSMERASTTWNDQVASRRRGISGRFMSLSKRITTFGGRSATPAIGAGGSNYDSLQGFYRPDAPEAVMRKLADYSLMLRDFKLAQSTFEILCQDYKNDRAWRYYAGANEMAAISGLLAMGSGLSTKVRTESIDQYLETAHYSYITRVGSPYHALRTLLLGVELLKPRNGSALDDAARWLSKVLDDRLVGSVGIGGLHSGQRRRKAAFWNTLAGEAWLRQEKTGQAEKCIREAVRLYDLREDETGFQGIRRFLVDLQGAVKASRDGPQPFDGGLPDLQLDTQTVIEPLQDETPHSPLRAHRKSVSIASATSMQSASFDPLGAMPIVNEAGPGLSQQERRDDGFE
ncbi:hypothetical protein AMS68_004479 [Peltaster fructicola]|uniref:Transport protein particle subunit trs85-2 n=1 Tax=Peltaster fructicola TaxID=286661 RepID=A0A6H0XW14_9PEZI|nr:hypothetical protein AMS68_004479 [Peltaster fructicola]